MTALFTALLESETKESLVAMVCDLREENKKLKAMIALLKWEKREMQNELIERQ